MQLVAQVYIPNQAYVEINWNYLRNDLQTSVNVFLCFAHLCILHCWVVLRVFLQFDIFMSVCMAPFFKIFFLVF